MFMLPILLVCFSPAAEAEAEDLRRGKEMSVFTVVRFPNDPCSGSGNLNGTCYTASECNSRGGSASGSCASSFGVCCIFSLSCGATTSANTTYAMISSFDTSSGTDPCTYTYCKCSSDVCKLRIDYESMVLADPETLSTVVADIPESGANLGDCNTDSLSIGTPGFTPPPIICGYNTGQHMWVPACPSCVTITIDIDTASTATTRSWNIRVTQYECGNDNLKIPEENCLQYHTAQTGKIASFNWDTSTTTGLTAATAPNNVHLSNQHYNICIRRARGYCEICFSPTIHSTTAGIASSYGVSAGNVATDAAHQAAVDNICLGNTVVDAALLGAAASDAPIANQFGFGDYLEIGNMQNTAITDPTAIGVHKICGAVWNAINTQVATTTICSRDTPFRVGVKFDADEALLDAANVNGFGHTENNINADANGAGVGYTGFWLDYWQNSC